MAYFRLGRLKKHLIHRHKGLASRRKRSPFPSRGRQVIKLAEHVVSKTGYACLPWGRCHTVTVVQACMRSVRKNHFGTWGRCRTVAVAQASEDLSPRWPTCLPWGRCHVVTEGVDVYFHQYIYVGSLCFGVIEIIFRILTWEGTK